ncbi:MAG: metallophosphoesterase [Spirochaetales bacterium]|nr:metallophosphoesterase [Spirochaetales bacterium]
MKKTDIGSVKRMLLRAQSRTAPAHASEYCGLLDRVNAVLESEDPRTRPRDTKGLPGGIVYLGHDRRTIIVPDLHTRLGFLNTVLTSGDGLALSLLAEGRLQVVCLGDGLHNEQNIQRWLLAYNEYEHGFRDHRFMDEEMAEGLGLMEAVMELKCTFPDGFHFLKGNHENIANETGNGNYSFYKYAEEGAMVTAYVKKVMGKEFFNAYYRFEKNLPLFAAGRNFLTSHAEPARFFSEDEIIEYRRNQEAVYGLTWTPNNKAKAGSVETMLDHYIAEENREEAYYFGGHRPVRGLFGKRAHGRYIQIHNPDRYVVAVIKESGGIDLKQSIMGLDDGKYIGI